MPNNWAEWDAAHGHGEGRTRSADKLAAMIKGTLGHTAAPAPSHGSHGSVVHRTTKKDLKRPAPVKGEKDSADSMRTQIRMAAYQRKKAAATGQDPVDKATPRTEQKVNPHTPTSAEKLVADRNGRYETARHEAYQATRAADSGQADPAKDRAAAEAHRRAADLAPDDQKQRAHDTQARIHRQQAKQVETARSADKPEQDDRQTIVAKAMAAGEKANRTRNAADHAEAHAAYMRAHDAIAKGPKSQLAPYYKRQAQIHQAEAKRHEVSAAAPRSAGSLDESKLSLVRGDSAYQNASKHAPAATAKESKAVDAYTLDSFGVNEQLRKGVPIHSAKVGVHQEDSAADVASLTGRSKLPEDTELWRGVYNADDFFGPVGSKVGKRFVDHGFTSTSTDRTQAVHFGSAELGGAEVRIVAPKGTRGMAVGHLSSAYGDDQREILLHHGTTFHVAQDRLNPDGSRSVTLHVVPREGR